MEQIKDKIENARLRVERKAASVTRVKEPDQEESKPFFSNRNKNQGSVGNLKVMKQTSSIG